MKIILLGITMLCALADAGACIANSDIPNRLGYIPAYSSATIFCPASRFFPPPSTPDATVSMDEVRPGGLETNFLITNTSDSKVLEIVKVDIYSKAGRIISRLTPDTAIAPVEDEPAFKWLLAPHETTRLPHQATLPPTQRTKPDLLWNNVVFTVRSADRGAIIAPMVFSDHIEYETPAIGGGVLDRIRADCAYR